MGNKITLTGTLAGRLATARSKCRSRCRPVTLFDDDVFVGARLALNDTASSELLAGVLVDRQTLAWTFNLEAERRLTDHLLAEVRARAFGNGEPPGIIDQLSRDDYVQISLRYYF